LVRGRACGCSGVVSVWKWEEIYVYERVRVQSELAKEATTPSES
jgi:hypothetical protein